VFDVEKRNLLRKILLNLKEHQGMLYLQEEGGQPVVILPLLLVSEVVKQAHGTLLTGHGSIYKTLACLRSQYYWPFIGKDIQQAIQECDRCQKAFKKGYNQNKPQPFTGIIQCVFLQHHKASNYGDDPCGVNVRISPQINVRKRNSTVQRGSNNGHSESLHNAGMLVNKEPLQQTDIYKQNHDKRISQDRGIIGSNIW
jgi:hypothetical protein